MAFLILQAVPQPPQLAASMAVLVSHPSLLSLLQSAQPLLQAPVPQAPPAQVATALVALQTVPQAPQLAGSVWSSARSSATRIQTIQARR